MLARVDNELKIVLLFLLTNIAAQNIQSSNLLSRLLANSKGPVVVIIDPGEKSDELELPENQKGVLRNAETENIDIAADEDVLPAEPYTPNTGVDDAYALYSLLRTTQENENLDSEENDKFEETKDVLRSYFKERCSLRKRCEDECSEEPKCPINCQKVFDSLNACKPKKTKKKKKKNECSDECDNSSDKCSDECNVSDKCSDECNVSNTCSDECGTTVKGRTMPPKKDNANKYCD